jgi:hypothetical protein
LSVTINFESTWYWHRDSAQKDFHSDFSKVLLLFVLGTLLIEVQRRNRSNLRETVAEKGNRIFGILSSGEMN